MNFHYRKSLEIAFFSDNFENAMFLGLMIPRIKNSKASLIFFGGAPEKRNKFYFI